MTIAGLQKTTLLDYPGKVACTVFLSGCNFRCPFCQNSEILTGSGGEQIPEAELFAFLERRRGILDGVCVSGGEPLLGDVAPLLERIKGLGYSVKIDTNGAFPEKLKELYGRGLVDFVAMDVKNSPQKYEKTAGARVDIGVDIRLHHRNRELARKRLDGTQKRCGLARAGARHEVQQKRALAPEPRTELVRLAVVVGKYALLYLDNAKISHGTAVRRKVLTFRQIQD